MLKEITFTLSSGVGLVAGSEAYEDMKRLIESSGPDVVKVRVDDGVVIDAAFAQESLCRAVRRLSPKVAFALVGELGPNNLVNFSLALAAHGLTVWAKTRRTGDHLEDYQPLGYSLTRAEVESLKWIRQSLGFPPSEARLRDWPPATSEAMARELDMSLEAACQRLALLWKRGLLRRDLLGRSEAGRRIYRYTPTYRSGETL